MAGEIFKKRREEQGIDIRSVSAVLKIGPEFLSAIENDDYEKLPVAVYTIGYIRCYAKHLDLDAEPVIADFRSHLSSPKPSTIIPVSSSRRKVPASFFVVFVLLAGFLSFILFDYLLKNRPDVQPPENGKVDGQVQNAVSSLPLNTEGLPARTLQESIPEEVSQAPAGQAQVAADMQEHELRITTSDTVWVQISFQDGKVEEKLLGSGISMTWKYTGSAKLKIGNAGGVALKFNGKDFGVPGSAGQVVNLTFPQP